MISIIAASIKFEFIPISVYVVRGALLSKHIQHILDMWRGDDQAADHSP